MIDEIRLPILSISVSSVTKKVFFETIRRKLSARERCIVAGHNLHSVYLSHTNEIVRDFYDNADLVLADGFPISVASINSTSLKIRSERLGSTDWLPEIITTTQDLRLAVVGGSSLSNSRFVDWAKVMNPAAEIMGWSGDNWSSVRAQSVAIELNTFSPQLVIVGLGMPLQETFIVEFLLEFDSCVVASVGGAIDQLSGVQKNAPRFLGKLGLEWLFRLTTQPKRLWKRYLLEPLKLARILIQMRLKKRKKN